MTAPATSSESMVWSIDSSASTDETPLRSYRPAPEAEPAENDLFIPEFLQIPKGAPRVLSIAPGAEAQVRATSHHFAYIASRLGVASRVYPSQQEAIQSLEQVRDLLDLTNETCARLLGSSSRR